MSHMETVPFFGTLTFNAYAPLLIVLLSLATYFNIYGKVLAWLSVEHEDALIFGEEFEEKEREGKILLGKQGRGSGAGRRQQQTEFCRINTTDNDNEADNEFSI